MALPSPEHARGWLQTVLAVTDKATSVTLVFMLVTGGLFGWYMLQELARVRTMNLDLWKQLLAAEKATLELALRCHPAAGEGR